MAKNRRRVHKKRTERWQSQRQVKRIDVLPDDVLLEIFDFCMNEYPILPVKWRAHAWSSLVHVCRQWRSLVFRSPRRLNLQLYCTPQTPAKDTLDVWPAFPLIIHGSMAITSGTDNIVAALGKSNRVCDVELRLARWQLEEVLAAMQVPFPELTDLRLSESSHDEVSSVTHDETPPVIPDSFLDGFAPRFRNFSLHGIIFPGLPNLFPSATSLVFLNLSDIPHSGYISPEDLVPPLSALSSLEILSLGFRSPQSRPDLENRSLPRQKPSVLPALRRLHFKGVTEYLEELVTRVDTPQLDGMNITFFNQIDFVCIRLAQFIHRTPKLRARDEAHVQFDDTTASVTLRDQISESGYNLLIYISCGEPDWQLSSIEQVCNSLYPLSTPKTRGLYIEHEYSQLVWKSGDIENILWLELLLPFTAVENLYLSKEFAPGIAVALQGLVGITEVLPKVQNIFVEGLEPSGPLQENIGRFVAARQLSGHPNVISIRTWKKPPKHSQRKRIDALPNDVLLDIFDFYMNIYSSYRGKSGIEAWQSLVHVCERWRDLVFQSQRRLNLQLYLQLYCTHETPVKDLLDIWPPLPLVVAGNMALSSGTDNLIAALGQSNRIRQVELHLTGWRLEEVLAPMQVSFPELTDMELSSDDETPPVIPDWFLDGSAPRLRNFSLYGIQFPALPNLLLCTTHLVDLHLSNIPHSGYISPEVMVILLSAFSSLGTLTLEFQSPQPRPHWESRGLPPRKRSFIPALYEFRFKGNTEYIEQLVTCIDTPQLDEMDITFFNQIHFNCPQLAQFISRTPTLRGLDEAHLQFDDSIVSVTLRYRTSESGSDILLINILCREPDWQLSSIEQICSDSALYALSTVEDLYIEYEYPQLVWKNDTIENVQWLELLHPFTAVRNLYLSKEFASSIAAALQQLVGGRIMEVFPRLQNIFVEGLESLQEKFWTFVVARQFSDHRIAIFVWRK